MKASGSSLETLLSSPDSLTVIAEVKCITVTPTRQEWRSLKTRRRYDVLSSNGIANASVGDKGVVVKVGSGWRILSPDDIKANTLDGVSPPE